MKQLGIHIEEEHQLGYNIDMALRNMVGEVNNLLRQKGVNLQHSQFSLMLYLEKNEGVSQSQLASLTGKNPAAILRSINYLEEKEYVFRKAKSGCKNMVFLTESGKKLLPTLNGIANEVTQTALSGISEEDKTLLTELLGKINSNFQN